MLMRLMVKDFALIHQIELEFDDRLNVLTGETGAGKSIIIDAVSLLLGASYMMVVDNVSRLLLAKEIPIGILTAFIGAPFFLYLILKEGNSL